MSRKRPGFSLIELLVVVAVVAILLALLLPAVFRSRQAARRTQCLNNMRQLGIALSHYHDTHSLFPPAAVWAGPPGEPLGAGQLPIGLIDHRLAGEPQGRMSANWLVMLLPQLDQAPLYQSYNSLLPVDAEENQTVREASLPFLQCPSDPYNADPYSRGSTDDHLYARGNYALNFGPDRLCAIEADPENCRGGFHVDSVDMLNENSVLWGSGLGGFNKSFSYADVTAGTSNVVIVDEIRAGPHHRDSRGAWALGFVGSSLTARHGLADSRREDSYGPNNQNEGADDIWGCAEVAADKGASWLSEQEMPCNAGTMTADQATARSLHNAGVHVLKCDGSAEFVSDSVSLEIWFNQHRRDGGQGVEEEF